MIQPQAIASFNLLNDWSSIIDHVLLSNRLCIRTNKIDVKYITYNTHDGN